jgi:predicted amidohydrolase
MPTKTNSGIKISMLIFQAGEARKVYSKQLLHTDEVPYFINGGSQIIVTVKDKKIAPAICYESLQDEHAEQAYRMGAEIYLASVAKSQKGIDKAMIHYPSVARQFSIPVLMANCVGYCDNFLSVGKSAVWTKQGNLTLQLDDKVEGILIYDTLTEEVFAHHNFRL